jgi:hypothetical protein
LGTVTIRGLAHGRQAEDLGISQILKCLGLAAYSEGPVAP